MPGMEVNMTDFIVIGIILVLVIGVSFYIWKRKKAGKSACGCDGGCSGCGGSCHGEH
ncbi:LPXTG-motif cell wall-anchored protein [Anaerotaenia torta]|uniref:FeoB-associated Cys-rich membrane protein n=1 Tax=Anaerotaenia torta TaxID=433293 RepID=UPI003D20BC3E